MPAWENLFISGKKRAFMNRGVVITENDASP